MDGCGDAVEIVCHELLHQIDAVANRRRGSRASARRPVPISGVPYALETGAAVSEGDSFRITYSGRNSFEMAIVQQGKPRRFDTLSFNDPSGRRSYNRSLRTVKMPDGSVRVPAPGVVFTVTNYNKADKSTDIIWPAVAEPVIVPIPDVVRESNGFSY